MSPARWYGIRLLRWYVAGFLLYRHADKWARMGLGLGYPNRADLEHLDRIRSGEA